MTAHRYRITWKDSSVGDIVDTNLSGTGPGGLLTAAEVFAAAQNGTLPTGFFLKRGNRVPDSNDWFSNIDAVEALGASPPSAGRSTVSATSPIQAGVGTSTITVTVRDELGQPIQGVSVVLSVTPKVAASNTVVQPAATNASGVTTGTLSTAAGFTGIRTVSAVAANGIGIAQNATVVVTP